MFRPNLGLLAAVGIVLVGSLVFLIWRSWKQKETSVAEQKFLLLIAVNTALAPALTFLTAYLLRPTLGVTIASTIGAGGLSISILSRAHGVTLGHEGLYRRVRNLIAYYAYLFLLLSQFPKFHVALTWYLGDPGRAQLALVMALLIPAFATLMAARPGTDEWSRWWPIRQWSALFLVGLLSLWMWLTWKR